MKNDKQRCGTRRYHQSEMKNPTTLISGTVTPKWTVPGERNLQFFYDSNEVLFSFFNMVLSKKQKYYLIGVRLMLECLKLSTISGLKLMSFALMFILWNEKLDR